MLDPPKKIYARTPTSNPTKIIIKLKHFTGKKAKKKKKAFSYLALALNIIQLSYYFFRRKKACLKINMLPLKLLILVVYSLPDHKNWNLFSSLVALYLCFSTVTIG